MLTPCIQVCELDEEGRCIGCARTAQEIAAWTRYDEATRRAIMDELPARRSAAEARAAIRPTQ